MAELLELQETLYSSRNPTRRWLHRARLASIEGTLRAVAEAGETRRALEVGPGSGVYLPLLCEHYDEVVASDVEEQFLAQARRLAEAHANLAAVDDDVTDSRLEAGSFDLVLCSEVIEHLPDSRPALAGIRRLLAPGGRLVLSTPQRHSPLELAGRVAFLPGFIHVARAAYREPVLPTGHVNLLTPREARAQLEQAGFRVLESWATGVYLPLVAELGGRLALRLEQWLERRLAGTRLSPLLWTQYYVVAP